MGTITRKSTKKNYKSAFKTYMQFIKLSPSELIDEAIEDLKRDPREKQDIVMRRLIDFYHWLKTEYKKKSRGKGEQKTTGTGVSDKLAHTRVGSIRSFYATFGITVRMKGRHRLPRPRITNKRMIVNASQVKTLVDHARTPRDRALILVNFQGGMDAETLCSIKYGDVSEGLTKNEHPLKLDLFREKNGVDHYTFLGRDAVKALKAYISDMTSRGVKYSHNTPLFLKERGKEEGMTTNLVQNMMKIVAHNAGFVDGENNGKAFNPLGPHALRESFGSIMINSGVPDSIVDFWLGHRIGEMGEAYKSVQAESLKKMYLEREKLLSFSVPKVDVEELEKKVRAEVQQHSQSLQILVNGLSMENLEMKSKIAKVELENTRMQREIEKIESMYEVAAELYRQLQPKELEKMIRNILRETKEDA